MPKPKIARSTIFSLIILLIVLMIYIALITEQPEAHTEENSTNQSPPTHQLVTKNTMNIQPLLKTAFPKLPSPASQNLSFEQLHDWLNQTPSAYMGYVELKEYYDNGIEENLVLKQAKVDTVQLQKDIEQNIHNKLSTLDEDTYDFVEAYDLTYEAFFDTLEQYAQQADLDLLVIQRENPYWMVVPRKAQVSQKIVDTFNAKYGDDEYMGEMVVYLK